MDVLLIMNVGSMNIAPGSLHLDYYEDSVEPFCQTDQFAYEMKNVWTFVQVVDAPVALRYIEILRFRKHPTYSLNCIPNFHKCNVFSFILIIKDGHCKDGQYCANTLLPLVANVCSGWCEDVCMVSAQCGGSCPVCSWRFRCERQTRSEAFINTIPIFNFI